MKKNLQPGRNGTKEWRRNIDISDVYDHLEEVSKDEVFGGPVKDMENQELFVIDKVGVPPPKHKKRLRIDEILDNKSEVKPFGGCLPKKKKKIVFGDKSKSKVFNNKQPDPPKETTASMDVWEIPLEQKVKLPDTMKDIPLVKLYTPGVSVMAGMSYNPQKSDHQELLQNALDIELEKINKSSFQEIIISKEESHLSMSVEDIPEAEDALIEEEDKVLPLANNAPRRKTKSQRNKELRQKEMEENYRNEMLIKKQNVEIVSLKKIRRQLADEKIQRETRILNRKKRVFDKKSKAPMRVSTIEFKEISLPLKLTEELPDNLRSLVPEGDIWKERFNSLQKRNLIETRIPIIPFRRYPLRICEK
jgi:nucleolar protein 53